MFCNKIDAAECRLIDLNIGTRPAVCKKEVFQAGVDI
jgi:hypothetical protein